MRIHFYRRNGSNKLHVLKAEASVGGFSAPNSASSNDGETELRLALGPVLAPRCPDPAVRRHYPRITHDPQGSPGM